MLFENPAIMFLGFAGGYIFVARIIAEVTRRAQLRRYAEITEPIFERSRNADDIDVAARADRHRWLLIESENVWRPPVIEAIFQEAGFWGETWAEFESRAADLERITMNDWLLKSKSRDPLHYLNVNLRQRASMN